MNGVSPAAEAGVLKGQCAVVTGGSKGIGYGIAASLVGAGADVVLVARDPAALNSACADLRRHASQGQRVLTAPADLADRNSIRELFSWLRVELPQLNVFVGNAGTGVITPFLELSVEEWDRQIALNLTGTFLCCQQAAQLMTKSTTDNRAILVVSSIRASGVRPGRLAYSATKAALNQLVRVAAYELAAEHIRVNVLSPGITETPLALEGNPEVFAEMAATVPLGRAGTPTDMGAAALYLCSPQARFVTGANLVVDGGESLW